MTIRAIEGAAESLADSATELPTGKLATLSRIQAAMTMLVALETINVRQNDDPGPVLDRALDDARGVLSAAHSVTAETVTGNAPNDHEALGVGYTVDLFENAWTAYSRETYDHSVGLVKEHLINSGLDEQWFQGKNCFDGGCGSGRLAIAIAQLGASKVTAVDLGAASLEFLQAEVESRGLTNIEIVHHDVTDLSEWDSDSFDFVASNGVLHHTEDCDHGIREHFRITKPGGTFWVYLYGAGGLYWRIFDLLRPLVRDIQPDEIRRTLRWLDIREGMIYTFLDNFLAPRVYFSLDEFLRVLEGSGEFTWRHAKGMSVIDDTELLLNTTYGAEIYGPDGEIRLVINKSGA